MDAMPAPSNVKTPEKDKKAQQRVHERRINALNLEPTLPRSVVTEGQGHWYQRANVWKNDRHQWREEEDRRRRQQRLSAEDKEHRQQWRDAVDSDMPHQERLEREEHGLSRDEERRRDE